jgi:SAM-dependent methyltransferase
MTTDEAGTDPPGFGPLEPGAAASSAWDASADAWVATIGDAGDYSRRFVLDAPMLARATGRGFRDALDVGCGEGRFCRMLGAAGIRAIGIDPTRSLIERARALDPAGDYRLGYAETIDLAGATFDLVVSYLTLIDIADVEPAIDGMVAALRPGGTLLIANLTSFNTAGMPDGWTTGADGVTRFCIDRYLDERAVWVAWSGIRVQNWHRPLGTYMAAFLTRGLLLRHYAEPVPVDGDPDRAARYRRVPWFYIMEWEKPLP